MAHFFASLAAASRFGRRRNRIGVNIEGEVVRKLVVANGSWRDRKWNERWLEPDLQAGSLVPSEVKYFTKKQGNLINVITPEDILDVLAISDVIKEDISENESLKSSALFSMALKLLHDREREELQFTFLVQCKSQGAATGKEYLFKANSEVDMRSWVGLFRAMKSSIKPKGSNNLEKHLNTLRAAHRSNTYQGLMALIIYLNFVVCVVGAQLNPDPNSNANAVLNRFDVALTWAFTADLVINLATSDFFSEFCPNSWSW